MWLKCTASHPIYAAKFEQTIINRYIYDGKVIHMNHRMCEWDYTKSINRSFVYTAKEGRYVRNLGENVIEPPFGFNIFLQYAFNLYTRLSINVILHPYVSVLIIGWGQNYLLLVVNISMNLEPDFENLEIHQ
jgi:hypothetical protein